jgi:hypothetical protein
VGQFSVGGNTHALTRWRRAEDNQTKHLSPAEPEFHKRLLAERKLGNPKAAGR